VRPAGAQGSAEEYQVKAAFLFHFAQLVEWPAGALNASDQSINLCIFNDEPRRRELQTTIEGKPIGARVLRVRTLDQQQSIQGCNILFLSRDECRRQAAVLRSVRDLPVLTVGEADDFLSDGGMIHFHLDGDKVRFDINASDADSSRLRISSRLLLLATSVTQSATIGAGKASYAH
jgi:tRNA threonylcarbamoyladenosine modification (KEOPS) complex  Pcc1 subunit